MALLRHFERLAAAHTPRDFTTDVERSVRQAMRSKRSVRGKLSLERAEALARPPHVADSSPTTRTDRHRILATLGLNTPHEQGLDLEPKAPTPSIRKPRGNPETLGAVGGTSASFVPFCVDTSKEAFCSFLTLVQGVRERGSSVGPLSTHTPNGAQASSSLSPSLDGIEQSRKGSGDIEPESSSPGESSPGGFLDARKLDSPPNTQHETALAGACDILLASRPVQTEVWRCTLKLLKINLFHLARVAAVRHSCCNDSGRGATPDLHSLDNKHTPDTQVGGVGESREENRTHAHRDVRKGGPQKADISQDSALKSRENIEITSKGDEEVIPGRKEAILPGLGREICQPEGGRAQDMYGVIQDIHTALRALLEDDLEGECPETTKSAAAVQVSSVLVGFVVLVVDPCHKNLRTRAVRATNRASTIESALACSICFSHN